MCCNASPGCYSLDKTASGWLRDRTEVVSPYWRTGKQHLHREDVNVFSVKLSWDACVSSLMVQVQVSYGSLCSQWDKRKVTNHVYIRKLCSSLSLSCWGKHHSRWVSLYGAFTFLLALVYSIGSYFQFYFLRLRAHTSIYRTGRQAALSLRKEITELLITWALSKRHHQWEWWFVNRIFRISLWKFEGITLWLSIFPLGLFLHSIISILLYLFYIISIPLYSSNYLSTYLTIILKIIFQS